MSTVPSAFRAIADFNAALEIELTTASSLYVRSLAKLKKGESRSGNADVAAAKKIRVNIAEEYVDYGVKP